MPLTSQEIIVQENTFYGMFLEKAIGFAEGTVTGLQFKQMVAAAGVVVRQKQTRGAMKALSYQVARDRNRKLLPAEFRVCDET